MVDDDGVRFEFGENWRRFLRLVDEERIAAAARSLSEMLGATGLGGCRFLDVGCGSGLASLAARRLGAAVHSFDSDPASVACADELRRRFAHGDPAWTIERGSVLDLEYLRGLGPFDVVHAWGVLHHTGDLRRAMDNVLAPLAAGGRLFVAIYNDQGIRSRYWLAVKRAYNRGLVGRLSMTALHLPVLYLPRLASRALTGRLRLARGMSLWRDYLDWLGGLPFEVARPGDVIAFYERRGLMAQTVKTCGRRSGCNEFVLARPIGGP